MTHCEDLDDIRLLQASFEDGQTLAFNYSGEKTSHIDKVFELNEVEQESGDRQAPGKAKSGKKQEKDKNVDGNQLFWLPLSQLEAWQLVTKGVNGGTETQEEAQMTVDEVSTCCSRSVIGKQIRYAVAGTVDSDSTVSLSSLEDF